MLNAFRQGQALQTGIGKCIIPYFRQGIGKIDLMNVAAPGKSPVTKAGQPLRKGYIRYGQMIPGSFCHGTVAGNHQLTVSIMNIGQIGAAAALPQHDSFPMRVEGRVCFERIDIGRRHGCAALRRGKPPKQPVSVAVHQGHIPKIWIILKHHRAWRTRHTVARYQIDGVRRRWWNIRDIRVQ